MRKISIVIAFFLLSSSLTACTKTIDVSTNPEEKLPLNLPLPEPVEMRELEFKIINHNNAESVFTELESKGLDPVLFGLSGQDYKSLSLNIQEIIHYLILQNEIIEAYKEYYERESSRRD